MKIWYSMLIAAALMANARAGSIWTLESTPTMETFNGVSIGADRFKVLVGNGGAIVHIDGDAPAVQVPSGTSQDLLDVYVVDRDFAVAVGRDVGVIWDGTSWTTFLQDTAATVFTSVWASPEKDVVIFNIPGSQFSFHRAYYPPTDTFRPGAFVSGFDIGYCGQSGDIKAIVANGSINNFDNNLGPAPGTESTFGVLFDNSAAPLNLTAAWFPPGACPSGPVVPFDAFAIDNNRFLYRFDFDTGWTQLPVDGGSIPSEQTLTWLAGTGPDNIVAVGFMDDMSGGNAGILWRWDGQLWTQDLTLPAGTPGLTDVAASFTFDNQVFADGFETPVLKGGAPGFSSDIQAAAEEGKIIQTAQLLPEATGDLSVEKELRDLGPFTVGQKVVFFVTIRNLGPGATLAVELTDRSDGIGLMFVSDDCATTAQYVPRIRTVSFPLAAGEIRVCRFEFEVTDVRFIRNDAIVYDRERAERDQSNNFSKVVVVP